MVSARKVKVEMTLLEAESVWALAGCASNSVDDALQVVDTMAKVNAGYRGQDKLFRAILEARR